jgi:hypothetical protein
MKTQTPQTVATLSEIEKKLKSLSENLADLKKKAQELSKA